MNDNPIVLFDGVCNFCNYWVNFAIKRNKKNTIRFTPLQSDTAKKLLKEFDLDPTLLSTVILIDAGKAYTQSSAALRLCKHLDGGWKLLYGLVIIPKFLRDAVYNIIARNRYKWFGKKETCMIPTKEMRERFLD